MYEPTFRYYSIRYAYSDGTRVTAGAYAGRDMAHMNARLNSHLSAEVVEVWY